MKPISRKVALSVGTLITAATVASGAGVASAATGTAAAAHPHAAAAVTRHLDRRIHRQTRVANRFDKVVTRLDTRSVKLTSRVDALADGTKKTDALAKLADLATMTAAVKFDDATVRSALGSIDVTNVAATRTTLASDLTTLKAARVDLRAARRDALAVVRDLRP